MEYFKYLEENITFNLSVIVSFYTVAVSIFIFFSLQNAKSCIKPLQSILKKVLHS